MLQLFLWGLALFASLTVTVFVVIVFLVERMIKAESAIVVNMRPGCWYTYEEYFKIVNGTCMAKTLLHSLLEEERMEARLGEKYRQTARGAKLPRDVQEQLCDVYVNQEKFECLEFRLIRRRGGCRRRWLKGWFGERTAQPAYV